MGRFLNSLSRDFYDTLKSAQTYIRVNKSVYFGCLTSWQLERLYPLEKHFPGHTMNLSSNCRNIVDHEFSVARVLVTYLSREHIES